MQVEMLTSMAGVRGSVEPGQVVEKKKEEADRLISKGYARIAETATRKAREKATKGRK
jgi:hypothetical protein